MDERSSRSNEADLFKWNIIEAQALLASGSDGKTKVSAC